MTATTVTIRNRQTLWRSLPPVAAGLCLALAFTLGGCLMPGAAPSPAPTPQPLPTNVAAPRPGDSRMPTTAPAVILLSDEGPSYRALAEQLTRRLETATTTLILRGPGDNLTGRLPAGNGALIAVGLEAAIAARAEVQQRDVIFALVFNHGDHRLLNQGMIGVSMLPPPAQTLRTLKALSPATTRVVLPCGPNLEEYTALVRRETERLGLTLESAAVGNDKELLLLVKRLDRSDAALWLLPDNRLVSRESLQQLMASNLKAARPTVVFSPSLFKIGGLLSAEYDLGAVAETIVALLQKTPEERARMKSTLLQPSRGVLAISGAMATTLGLTVPTALKPLLLEP